MDKLEFIEKAPGYYVLAIAVTLSRLGNELAASATIENTFDADEDYFRRDRLWGAAIVTLLRHGVIEVVPDDFGPTLYRPQPSIDEWLQKTAPTLYPWYPKFSAAGDPWLKAAMRNINNQYALLRLRDEDFDSAEEAEWEPIPVDLNDPALIEAIKAVDKAVVAIEGDNGYAVHAEGERSYVLASLKDFQRTLKERTVIYARQVKALVVDPLGRVIGRFGNAAVGLAASAAREAIFDWIKTHAAKLLSLLLP